MHLKLLASWAVLSLAPIWTAAAEERWEFIGQTDSLAAGYEATSRVRIESTVQVTTVGVFSKSRTGGEGLTYDYSVTKEVYDCSALRARQVSFVWYTIDGRPVARVSADGAWFDLPRGSAGVEVRNAVCDGVSNRVAPSSTAQEFAKRARTALVR